MRSARFLTVLAGIGVAICGTAAQADCLLPFFKTTDGVHYTYCTNALSYTRTAVQIPGQPSLDRIDIRFANIGAMAAPDSKLVALDGTWTALDGQMAVIQKYGTSTKSWYRYFDNDYTPGYIDEGSVIGSYVNFPYSGFNRPTDWVETGFGSPNVNNTAYGYSLGTSVMGMWFTADTNMQLGNGDLIASFYVTPGANISFQASKQNGTVLTDGLAFDSATSSANFGGWFGMSIPEPSTLLLAAYGAIGLLGYAWRKRRR